MFTGIIEATGRIVATTDVEGGRRIAIAAPASLLETARVGDSVAVDGACLTVTSLTAAPAADSPAPAADAPDTDTVFEVDLVLSTLERTIAGRYEPGRIVNLERAMVLGARLDGHLVQGHVDGTGRLLAVRDAGGTHFLEFEVPADIWEQTLLHGSITLNGVSLTVNTLVSPDRLGVAIIPHTWQVTNLAQLAPGDPVNVEGDLLGKYVSRLLATRGRIPEPDPRQ